MKYYFLGIIGFTIKNVPNPYYNSNRYLSISISYHIVINGELSCHLSLYREKLILYNIHNTYCTHN